ncbi:MAG: NADP-dependent oxidoreductase [Burkholderiaceae bacterium]
MNDTNRQWLLVRRPQGPITPDCFRLDETVIPEIGDGEILVRNHYLSLDPYMRGRLDAGKSYAVPQKLDEVMQGGTVGEVVASRNPAFAVGDKVLAMFGWQLYGKSDGNAVMKLDADRIPIQAYLGRVGMPGITGWYGLNRIIEPREGETVVVSAASGAVGSVVGQLARLKGCRVVGIAGGSEKCRAVVEEFGFDACVDYKAGKLHADLKAAAPDGVDGYFDNVGGEVLDAVLGRMNTFGRIAICGLISGYDGGAMPINEFRSLLINRLKVQGFIVSDHMSMWPQARSELLELAASGTLRYRESVVQGIEAAPEALMGLLKGRNFGKQLVRLID